MGGIPSVSFSGGSLESDVVEKELNLGYSSVEMAFGQSASLPKILKIEMLFK